MNTVTHTCPPLEDIAAFLDGKLSEGERARVVAHLADCESCYAVFAGAARYQLEEEDEATQEHEEAAAAVVPFRRRPPLPWVAAAALAAFLLIGLALIPRLYRSSEAMPV
ncbi:MAG TPA: zf-HC2 domain-containing protein, partial [Thermoanaerobaculia bacterium]|nr:zf-HC2 domain-containing protein [Thermoanaerobaculia bacterium]